MISKGPTANAKPGSTNSLAQTTNEPPSTQSATDARPGEKKRGDEPAKAVEVVFVVEGDHVKAVPVKRGISDDDYVEIVEGLSEGQEIVSGTYKAINHELEDGKKIKVVPARSEATPKAE